jgi:acyl dehydratase
MSGVSNLTPGTWEDAEAFVGQTIAVLRGADAVTAADIRRKLEVIGFDCALHTDPDVAREHGYADVIAPASMVRVWAMPSYWAPGETRIGTELMTTPIPATKIPGDGDAMIATGVRTEHVAPVHPGDRVTATAVLKSVTRKTTRVGPGAFLVLETTYRNQREDPVAIETVTLLRYWQRPPDEAGA